MPTAAWQNTLPTPSPGPWNCPHQACPGSANLPCPHFRSAAPAAAGPREMTRGQGKAAALVVWSRKHQFWQPGRQPVLARAPNQAFRPRSSDKVQITAGQLRAAEPRAGLSRGLAAALPHSAVGRNRPSRGLKDQRCARSTRPSCEGRSPAGRRAVTEPGEGSNSLGGRGLGRAGEARAHSIRKIK